MQVFWFKICLQEIRELVVIKKNISEMVIEKYVMMIMYPVLATAGEVEDHARNLEELSQQVKTIAAAVEEISYLKPYVSPH